MQHQPQTAGGSPLSPSAYDTPAHLSMSMPIPSLSVNVIVVSSLVLKRRRRLGANVCGRTGSRAL